MFYRERLLGIFDATGILLEILFSNICGLANMSLFINDKLRLGEVEQLA